MLPAELRLNFGGAYIPGHEHSRIVTPPKLVSDLAEREWFAALFELGHQLGHIRDAQRRRSGQVRRADTPSVPMLCGRVAARAADSHLDVPLQLGHVRVFRSEVDGSMTLDERHRTV